MWPRAGLIDRGIVTEIREIVRQWLGGVPVKRIAAQLTDAAIEQILVRARPPVYRR